MPSSSSMFCSRSDSAWLRVKATRTSSPWAKRGSILRARSCSGVRGSALPAPAWTSGIPQFVQKRSSGPWRLAHDGQTSDESDDVDRFFLDLAIRDPPCPHARLAGERDDHVE